MSAGADAGRGMDHKTTCDLSAVPGAPESVEHDESENCLEGSGKRPPATEIVGGRVDVAQITTAKDFERFLRAAGFSRTRAKQITSVGFKPAAAVHDDADRLAALAAEIRASASAIRNLKD